MEIPKYKLVGWSVAILIVLLIALYVAEFDYIGNTLYFEKLLWKALVVALLIGAYFGWRFQERGEEQVDRIRIWSVSILLPLFFAPWLASLSNRMFSSKTINQSVEFIEVKPFSKSFKDIYEIVELEADGCFLFIYYEGKSIG